MMQLRKIVTGIVIASTLTLSAPVLAAPEPAGMLEGDGGAFAGGGFSAFGWIVSLAALGLSIGAIVDASKSP